MSVTKNQHYVPRCYLNKFSIDKDSRNFFVDVLFHPGKKKQKIKDRVNIKNICSSIDYYNFDNLPHTEKTWLETYYSENIESFYNDLYRILTDPNVDKIDLLTKTRLVAFIISQELRTPKYAKTLNLMTERLVKFTFAAAEQHGIRKVIKSDTGEVWDFEGMSMDEAIKYHEKSNRESANLAAVQHLRQLVKLKMNNLIVVKKIAGEDGLISSDRPVYMQAISLYDPAGKYSIAIDHRHLVTLQPFEKDIAYDSLQICRINDMGVKLGLPTTLIYNSAQLENSQLLVYGKSADINRTLSFYNEKFTNKAKQI